MRLKNRPVRVQPTRTDSSPLRYRAMMEAAGASTVSYDGEFVEAHAVSPEIAHLGTWLRFDFRPPEARGRNGSGWKVHISVDTSQAAEAWDAALPVVAGARLLCKAVGPAILDAIGDPRHRQAGKAIVLYDHGHPLADDPVFWTGILSDVEGALASAGIRPGWTVAGDRPVSGSAYAFVRNDADISGRYAEAGAWFNPAGAPCPFDAVSLAPRPDVPAHADPVTDAVRQLRMVGGDWKAAPGGAVLASGAGPAGIIRKALASSGILADDAEAGLSVAHARLPALRNGWFRAAQVARAAELGRIVSVAWEKLTGERSTVSARLPRDGADMPSFVLGFGNDRSAESFAEAFDRPRGFRGAVAEDASAAVPLPAWAFEATGADPALAEHAVRAASASLPGPAAAPR